MFDAAIRPNVQATCVRQLANATQVESWIDAGVLLACLQDAAFCDQPGTDRLLLLSARFGQVFLSSAAGSRAIASFMSSEDPWGGNLIVERRSLLQVLEQLPEPTRLALRFDAQGGQLWIGTHTLRASLMTRLS